MCLYIYIYTYYTDMYYVYIHMHILHPLKCILTRARCGQRASDSSVNSAEGIMHEHLDYISDLLDGDKLIDT